MDPIEVDMLRAQRWAILVSFNRYLKAPDCRDPEHMGCLRCAEPQPNEDTPDDDER